MALTSRVQDLHDLREGELQGWSSIACTWDEGPVWASWWPMLVVHGSKSALSGPQGSIFRGYELSQLLVPSAYEQQRGRGRLDGKQKAH